VNCEPAPPGGEPRFIGPLGYVLRSACYGGTRVDIIPFLADEPADATQPVLNERIYTRLRPEKGDLHVVVGWQRGEPGAGIYPKMMVYAKIEEIFAAHPDLRERAGAFENAEVRRFPGRSEEERGRGVHGAALELSPGHPTPGLFSFGFGEEMPYVRVTPVEMGGGYYLLFERTGYRHFKKRTWLYAKAQRRRLPPGLLELRQEGSGYAVALHRGSDPRRGGAVFDGFPHFNEYLTYAQEVAAAADTRTHSLRRPVQRVTVGKTPGKTPSGLQVYTLQYLRGGVSADITPFFVDEYPPERIYVRFTSPAAEVHAVATAREAGAWGRHLVIAPFDDRESLLAAYPILREAVDAAEVGETWQLPLLHPVQDVFQQWRCPGRPEITATPVEGEGCYAVAFEWEAPWGEGKPRVIGLIAMDGRPEDHPGLAADRDCVCSAGTVQWQDVIPGRLGAACGRSDTGLQALPVLDEAGGELLLIRRGAGRPSFTLVTWPGGEGAVPVGAAGEYPGIEELLSTHPDLEASLICANQHLVMPCRQTRPEGGA